MKSNNHSVLGISHSALRLRNGKTYIFYIGKLNGSWCTKCSSYKWGYIVIEMRAHFYKLPNPYQIRLFEDHFSWLSVFTLFCWVVEYDIVREFSVRTHRVIIQICILNVYKLEE